MEEGNLDTEVQVYDGTELDQLQAGFNEMVRGLRDREHLRDLFGRHVGKDVAEAAALGNVELGGESRVVSVLDIVGSTTLATENQPAAVVELLKVWSTSSSATRPWPSASPPIELEDHAD